jgi:hypothetical protein
MPQYRHHKETCLHQIIACSFIYVCLKISKLYVRVDINSAVTFFERVIPKTGSFSAEIGLPSHGLPHKNKFRSE